MPSDGRQTGRAKLSRRLCSTGRASRAAFVRVPWAWIEKLDAELRKGGATQADAMLDGLFAHPGLEKYRDALRSGQDAIRPTPSSREA